MLDCALLAGNDDDSSIIDVEAGDRTTSTTPLRTSFRNRLASLGVVLLSLLVAILPSFVQPLLPRRLTSTTTLPIYNPDHSDALTYLTGVRGLASIVVFVYHWTHGSYHGSMDYAYGDDNSTTSESSATHNDHILQLPLLRLFYAAEAMVALFFVLSGYVLSYRPVQQMHARTSTSAPLVILSALAFRRAPRLYLPAIAATLLAFLLQLVGAIPAPTTPSALAMLVPFLHRLLLSGVWTWDTLPGPGWSLHPHLWTVPTEWRCSMALFALLLSTAGRAPLSRLLLDAGVATWCLAAGRWDVALFVAGAVLSELRARGEAQRTPPGTKPVPWRDVLRTAALGAMLLLGLLLAGYPPRPPAAGTPLYGPLAVLGGGDPGARRVYYALGAMLAIGALDRLPGAQRPFRSRVALYFGRISYALYLVHGLLIRSVGQRVLDVVWEASAGPREAEGGGWWFGARFGLASVLFVPIVLWGADLFERGVERRLVVWAKNL